MEGWEDEWMMWVNEVLMSGKGSKCDNQSVCNMGKWSNKWGVKVSSVEEMDVYDEFVTKLVKCVMSDTFSKLSNKSGFVK